MGSRSKFETAATRAIGAILFAIALLVSSAEADDVKVAVAANFTTAAREIGDLFEKKTGHTVVHSFGSTGQLYAQITQNAPFDVLLAADQERPEKAISEGFAVAGTRFTYATGRIVLYSADAALVDGKETLERGKFQKIAIANPKTAPYGTAAIATMKALGVYDALEKKIVKGNNIAQTHQFVASGNAEVGFVALSQIAGHNDGSRWVIPTGFYPVIAQDGVLLKKGAGNPVAKAYLAFLNGPDARAVKDRFGYGSGD